jgi:acetoin:2,6-dichlorophenolindophenol oxidoreductase subunit alpha
MADRNLEIFRRMAYARAFDLRVKRAIDDGDVKTLCYLGTGQESIAAAISVNFERGNPHVLGQHRGHSTYLSFGGDPAGLVDELLGASSGCCGGNGGSPMVHDRAAGIIGHCGLIGDQVPIACGLALADPSRPVVCFFGDGAAEEDYVLSALGFAATHKLNILFVCEDNNLSVLTPVKDRRSWRVVDVAHAFGITAAADMLDDPFALDTVVQGMLKRGLPALLNVQTRRECWHVGSGSDGPPEWDRWGMTIDKLESMGLAEQCEAAEIEAANQVEALWAARLKARAG